MAQIKITNKTILKDVEGKLPRILGTLEYNGAQFFVMSKPVRKNLKKISGVEDGTYKSYLRDSANNIPYKHIKLTVPNREYIAIYSGSRCTELDGHFLIGDGVAFDAIYQMYDLTNTKQCLDTLVGMINADEELTVIVESEIPLQVDSPPHTSIDVKKFSGYHSFQYDPLEIPAYSVIYQDKQAFHEVQKTLSKKIKR